MAQKPLYIIKIGGSVATHKDKEGFSVRKKLLGDVAQSIKKAQEKEEFDLILIHGAGAAGHQLAKKFKLAEGANEINRRFKGALQSCVINQKLNNFISDILNFKGLNTFSIHTASTIIQKNKKIVYCNLNLIKKALENNCIPIMYGEMVFDKELQMSICSGDAIAPYLARKLKAEKVFFASDIDGIFNKDPHEFKNVKLIENINLKEIKKEVSLGESHNTDVTGGLLGKIEKITGNYDNHLKSIEIFNGLEAKNYQKIILGKKFPHTTITM